MNYFPLVITANYIHLSLLDLSQMKVGIKHNTVYQRCKYIYYYIWFV